MEEPGIYKERLSQLPVVGHISLGSGNRGAVSGVADRRIKALENKVIDLELKLDDLIVDLTMLKVHISNVLEKDE